MARTLTGKVCSGLVDVRRCLDRRSQPGSCLAGPLGHRRQPRRIEFHITCPHMADAGSRFCSLALAPTARRDDGVRVRRARVTGGEYLGSVSTPWGTSGERTVRHIAVSRRRSRADLSVRNAGAHRSRSRGRRSRQAPRGRAPESARRSVPQKPLMRPSAVTTRGSPAATLWPSEPQARAVQRPHIVATWGRRRGAGRGCATQGPSVAPSPPSVGGEAFGRAMDASNSLSRQGQRVPPH